MKWESGELVLSLDRIAAIEEKALKKLLKGIKEYRGRVSIVCEDGAEAIRALISKLPDEFAAFFREPGFEPA
ncbi:MAG: hypothetical protein ACYTFG_15490, partial [Planctomycetota bacterium]|jgi:hypothetical protein